MVFGEGQKFPAALIVPSFAFVTEWAKRKKIEIGDGSNEAIANSEVVHARIMQEVEGFNKGYGSWEKIKKISLLSRELSIVGGELTPTLKLKRKKVMELHKAQCDAIYCD